MRQKISDYSIFQNHVLGAHALWEFSKQYQEYQEYNEPPILLLTLPVLPIVFNMRATNCIRSKSFKEGSLLKVITENKDIYAGLQERMEGSIDMTFKSIHIAVASGLLIYDKTTTQLIPNRKSELILKQSLDYTNILSASRRIGAWFAQLNIQEITDYFNIQY
ncbi:MAG: hypothetical protein IT271_12715 [Chitinophagales bacterium]|nr:hypothetical protein [Chitinophagales bacterium]